MTIFFLNPLNEPVPSGGVQKLHDHVQILNDAGLPAAIINPSRFKPWWFTPRARIVQPPVTLRPGDLLAIPEVYGDSLLSIAPGFPRVSINQNTFLTFSNVRNVASHPYLNCPSLLGIMTMSQHDYTYLTHTFPAVRVHRAFYGIDDDLFGFSGGHRLRKIAYMPRKRRQLAQQIIGSLHARGAIKGWELQEIRGMSHAQVAEAMGTSQLFLSFSPGGGIRPAAGGGASPRMSRHRLWRLGRERIFHRTEFEVDPGRRSRRLCQRGSRLDGAAVLGRRDRPSRVAIDSADLL